MTKFAGYEVEVPFGPAAGVLNGSNEQLLVEQTKDVIKSPVGFATLGSLTWNGGAGNEPEHGVVYYHNQLTGQTFNSMGLPNIGHERAKAIYPELQEMADGYGKPLIPSFSPGKGEDPLQVLPDMAESFAEADAPAVEINYSCPNKIDGTGGREPILGYDIETMQEIDDEIVRRIGRDILIIRKLPPYIGENRSKIPAVAAVFTQDRGNTVLNLSNTVGGQSGLTELGDPALKVPGNLGGMSGPATKEIGQDQLKQFRKLLSSAIGFISCLGVTTGYDVDRRVNTWGADLASGVTIYFENEKHGISYGETGSRIARQYAEAIETP